MHFRNLKLNKLFNDLHRRTHTHQHTRMRSISMGNVISWNIYQIWFNINSVLNELVHVAQMSVAEWVGMLNLL